MNPFFNIPSGSATKSIAKVFGVLFIVLCLIASALSIGLPHGSNAADDEVILKPVADTFINNLKPDQGNGQSSHLDVRGDLRMISFLRFEVSGLAQSSITKAHLRLFAIKGSDGRPVSLQLF